MDEEIKLLRKMRKEMSGGSQTNFGLTTLEWLPLALEMVEDGCSLGEIVEELGLVGKHQISIAFYGSQTEKPVATPDQTERYIAAISARSGRRRGNRNVTSTMSVAQRKAWILAQPSKPIVFPDGAKTSHHINNYKSKLSTSYDAVFAAAFCEKGWEKDYHRGRTSAVIDRFLAYDNPPIGRRGDTNDYNKWRLVLKGKLRYLEAVLRKQKPHWFT